MSRPSSRKNSGFATVTTILLVAGVVVIIAAIAFFVGRSNHKPVTPAQPPASSQPAKVATKPANTCLTLADLRSYAFSPIDSIARDTTIARVYFKADTTEYNSRLMPVSKPVGTRAYQLYQDTASKDYQFTVTGSTSEQSATKSDQQLAAARANKVKKELIARGIPTTRIIILPSTNGLAGGDLTRYAYIGVRVPESCVTK